MNIKENLILLVFLMILVAVGYFWYFQWRQPVVLEDDEGQSFGREFLTMAARIKKIDINTDFFSSEGFLFLKDFTPVIEPAESVGKKNPFLPIVSPIIPPKTEVR